MKPRRIFSALLLSLGLILLTFAATCRLVMTNIQIDYDPSSPATVTLYDEIIAAADFPVSLPVRDVLNYSSAAFMNYVKLGCNYITRKFNVRHSPTTVYSYGYNYSNEAIHEKASYPYTIDDFFADPLRKSLFVIGCYNYLHDVIDGKIKPTKMTEAKAETKPLTLQSATTLAAPPIAPTIPITKTNTVSCSATKTCAAYKPVPQSPAKP